MRRLLKILKWPSIVLVAATVITIGMALARQDQQFDASYPDIHASTDSAIIERGHYLVYDAAHCTECHANPDLRQACDSGDEIPLTGGGTIDMPIGCVYMPNLTPGPGGIAKLSDREIARSLRYGVGWDGRALFPFMAFHNMCDSDLKAVISYLRTLKPIEHKVPPPHSGLNLFGKIMYAFMIKPVNPIGEVLHKVTPDSSVFYGEYLAMSVCNCYGCHTKLDLTGKQVGELFAGGMPIDVPGDKSVVCISPNLTCDTETGRIANWSEEQFINRFRQGKLFPQSPMPWGNFKKMHTDDLKALYKYLRSLKPIVNETPAGVVKN
jgi:hypothetical protein